MTWIHNRRRIRRLGGRRLLVPAALLVSLLASPGTALAQQACDSSAIDQYVECLPTSGGEDGSGAVGGKPRVTPLPGSVAATVTARAGEDAPLLTAIATDSRFGAPQKKLDGGQKLEGAGLAPRALSDAALDDDGSAPGAVVAAVSAVQGGDSGRLIALLLALFLVSVATLGAAAMRQKRRAAV